MGCVKQLLGVAGGLIIGASLAVAALLVVGSFFGN